MNIENGQSSSNENDSLANIGYPYTIPALQEWIAGSGYYTFSDHTHIVIDHDYASQLQATAEVFAADLKQLTGYSIPIVESPSVEQTDDIVLTLTPNDVVLGAEGYLLEIKETIKISAPTEHGIFYGTRSILQLLQQHITIPAGTARDWPAYHQRSLMVDLGRKYFSIPWLENHIRTLAYLKYNYFHLHLSDYLGFRLESVHHPEIVAPEHYTKDEIRALLDLAQHYHITIVPEIDIPGHMDTALASHPELQLVSVTGERQLGDLDLSNEAAYVFVKDLLDEFIPLFPGPYWHIGADEYIMQKEYKDYPQLLTYARAHYGPDATERDTYLGFVNWANELVKSHGKITRAWNDGLYGGTRITVATDILIEHWLDSGLTPEEIVNSDISIMNANSDYLYYVLLPADRHNPFSASAQSIYEDYELTIFDENKIITHNQHRIVGAKLHVWCDDPAAKTENQIDAEIKPLLQALAQKNWGSPKIVPLYASYQIIETAIGQVPGYITLSGQNVSE
jgi:hexosaminidase